MYKYKQIQTLNNAPHLISFNKKMLQPDSKFVACFKTARPFKTGWPVLKWTAELHAYVQEFFV